MRHNKLLIFLAVSVFLFGTLTTTKVFAEGWKQTLAEHEEKINTLEGQANDYGTRIEDLEAEVDGLTTRIGAAETRLGTVEENQTELQSEVADNDARITALESLSIGAALGVSDANDVFLGHLVDFRQDVTLTVFNPDIPAHFKVVTKLPPYIEPNPLGIIAFNEAGCRGQMYSGIAGERHQFSLMYDDNNDNYYVFDNAVAAINHDENDPNPTLKSCFWIDDNTCNGWCFSGLYAVLKPVNLPPEFETLAYPIIVRPIQQP